MGFPSCYGQYISSDNWWLIFPFDFFSFCPRNNAIWFLCLPSIGYNLGRKWVKKNPHLNLGSSSKRLHSRQLSNNLPHQKVVMIITVITEIIISININPQASLTLTFTILKILIIKSIDLARKEWIIQWNIIFDRI